MTSRGFELKARSRLTDSLEFTSAYTYANARTENDKRKALVPYHQASLWLGHNLMYWGLDALKIGVGIRYLSNKLIEEETFKVPSSIQFDAKISYQVELFSLSLTANNLSDEEDFSQCHGVAAPLPRLVPLSPV